MIVLSLCNSCFQPYQLLLESSDMELVKQIATEDGRLCPCPRLCGGQINLVGEPAISAEVRYRKLAPHITLRGVQLYQAVKGMGLPDELPPDGDTVAAMLLAHRVVTVDFEEIPANLGKAVYLYELVLDNGVTIHLTAGQRGAQVLKMTKERDSGTDHQSPPAHR